MEPMNVYTKQQRIAELARLMPDLSFTSLAYHIDLEWMYEAYRRTRKDGAAGVDGVTAEEYEKDLDENLRSLLERFKSGSYIAPPVKRKYIPKGEGRFRPIGIPTLEDKILQRAVVMILTPLYEQDFLECSYGFRPERSVHQALESLWKGVMRMGGCWLLEVDIKSYFDTVNRKYLHEVLDVWFEGELKPRLNGQAELIRFADDYVILFTEKRDALRVQEVLPKRFGKYDLTLHDEKTRLVNFHRPSGSRHHSETFVLLGFTHYWGKSRKGNWVVQRKTAQKKLKTAVRKVYKWCKVHRHDPVKEQWQALCRKVHGHYGFYGITFNMRSLKLFYEQVKRAWRKSLDRRSRNRDMPWDRFNRLLKRYPLPGPRIVHSYV